MPEYRIKWEIDIDAATPEEAAEKARAIQQNPESAATVFEVTDRKTLASVQLDLMAPNYDPDLLELMDQAAEAGIPVRKHSGSAEVLDESGHPVEAGQYYFENPRNGCVYGPYDEPKQAAEEAIELARRLDNAPRF